jgi:hypothetical protein
MINQTLGFARDWGQVSNVSNVSDILLDKCTIAVSPCSPKCRLSSVRLGKLTAGIPHTGVGGGCVWQDGTTARGNHGS